MRRKEYMDSWSLSRWALATKAVDIENNIIASI